MFSEGFFKTTFGFAEGSYDDTQKMLLQHAKFFPLPAADHPDSADVAVPHPTAERCVLENLPHGRTLDCGRFSTPSLRELRQLVQAELAKPSTQEQLAALIKDSKEPLVSFRNVVGESFSMHCQSSLRGAVYQAASQFNYLEFPSPGCVPEKGINGYMHDRTQGPACAMACGAGTAFRNYLVQVGGQEEEGRRGQRAAAQLNGLSDATSYLLAATASEHPFYVVRNGYVDSTPEKLTRLNSFLVGGSGAAALCDELSALLRIGVQEDTEVTAPGAGRSYTRQSDGTWKETLNSDSLQKFFVTQTYNSALSVGYSRASDGLWEPFARVVLNGTYESTLLVGVLHTLRSMRRSAVTSTGTAGIAARVGAAAATSAVVTPVLLTKVGGGVFGNHMEWITDAMRSAVRLVAAYGVPMDVRVVHFQGIEDGYESLEKELTSNV
jgi:hypothetical protein